MHTHNEQLQEKKEQINNNAVERMNRNTFTHPTFPAVKCKQQCFVVIFSSFLFAFESSSGWNVVAMGKWGKMCRCVCVFGSIVSALLLLDSSIFYNKEAHQKRPLYWSVCALLWRLKFPLAEKSQQTMIWTMLFFASFCIALLCSVLNSNAREVNGSYIFLIVLVLDEFWVTNSCRETWLPKWWYDGNKDECDTYVTSASRSLSISLFLYKFQPAHPGICFWSVLFLVLKTRPHITKSRC